MFFNAEYIYKIKVSFIDKDKGESLSQKLCIYINLNTHEIHKIVH